MLKATQFPMSTGQVCRLLQTAEHRVINPIRQGKLDVPNIGGRRLWSTEHILRIARLLGKDTPEIRNICREHELRPDVETRIAQSSPRVDAPMAEAGR